MGEHKGFTVVEVILFLAISGMLLVVAMTGVSGSVRTNRMSDTTRSLESFIESQLADVSSGVVRQQVLTGGRLECAGVQKFPGASDDCLVMGKLLKFTTGTSPSVQVHNVVGNIDADALNCAAAATGVDKLKQYCPRVLEMSTPVEVYTPEWSAAITSISFLQNSSGIATNANSIAILRDPTSDFVYVSVFTTAATSGTLQMKDAIVLNADRTNAKGVICLNSGGFPALDSYVLFSGGSGTGSIKSAADAALPGGLTC